MASETITKIMDDIKALTVIELNDLVKELETEFGVSAAAMAVAAARPAAQPRKRKKRPSSPSS